MYCYEDPKLLKLFSAVIRILYDNDILDEDTIKFWYKKGSHAKVRRTRLPLLLDLESRTLCLPLKHTLFVQQQGRCLLWMAASRLIDMLLTRHLTSIRQGRNVFQRDMEPFLKWLDEAEEEDEE